MDPVYELLAKVVTHYSLNRVKVVQFIESIQQRLKNVLNAIEKITCVGLTSPMTSTFEDSLHSVPTSLRVERAYILLGYLGLVPFALSTGLIILSIVETGDANTSSFLGYYVPYVFLTYSACILSFLAGTLWRGQFHSEYDGSNMLLLSNLLAVLSWLSLLAMNLSHYLMLLSVVILGSGYVVAITAERSSPNVAPQYFVMRARLTWAVVVMHLIFLIALLWSL